ncbi:hypothetical protein HDV06_005451 [Boothiomyces sp. JEL0866]|nr:hypothetical protein HDV06_005451 [Boothiomyces sp. JEL0866]
MNDQEKLAILKDAVDQLCGEVTHLLILFKSQVQDETINQNEISIQNKSLVYQSILAEWSLIKSLFTLLVSNIANIDQEEVLSPIETILVKMKTDDAVFKNYEFQFPFHVNAMVNTVKTAFKNFCAGPKEDEQPKTIEKARQTKKTVTTAPIETTNVRDAAKKFQEISENIAESAKLKRPQTKKLVIGGQKGSSDVRTPDSALSGATLVGPKSAMFSPDEQEELKVDEEIKTGKALGKNKSFTVRAMPTTVKYVSVQKDDGGIDVVAQKIKLPLNALDAYKTSIEDLKKTASIELKHTDSKKGLQPQLATQHHVEVGKILSAKEEIGEHIISQKSDLVFTPDSSSFALKVEDKDVVEKDPLVKFKVESSAHSKTESYSTPTSLINSYFVDEEGNSLPPSARTSRNAQTQFKIENEYYKETILDPNSKQSIIKQEETSNDNFVRKLTDQFDTISRNEEVAEDPKKLTRSRVASVSEEVTKSRKGSVNDNPFHGSQQKSGDYSRKSSAVTATFPVEKTTSPADILTPTSHKKTNSSSSHKKSNSGTSPFQDNLEGSNVESIKISPSVAIPPRIAPQLNIAKRAPTLQTKLDSAASPVQAPVFTPKSATFGQPAPILAPKVTEQKPHLSDESGDQQHKEITRAHTFTPKSALKVNRVPPSFSGDADTSTNSPGDSNDALPSKTIAVNRISFSPTNAAPQLPKKAAPTLDEKATPTPVSKKMDSLLNDLEAQVDMLSQQASRESKTKSAVETYKVELDGGRIDDSNKRFSEPIALPTTVESQTVKHIEFDLEAQAFSVEKVEIIVQDSISRKSTSTNVQKSESRSRSNTGKASPEKINVSPDSLAAPPKNNNRDTIISPNPAAPLFSLAHDRNPSSEPVIQETEYIAPVETNQNRKLSDLYFSKRQSWNVKSSASSTNENSEAATHTRKRSEPQAVGVPGEENESIIIPLSKDEAAKVLSDSAQILNAYFDGDSITNLISDFPDIDIKEISERKNSAASVRTIIKQPRHVEASSNSKLANSFSLEELPDDNSDNAEISRYHTIIPKSKKKGKEKLSIALWEKSMHTKTNSYDTDSSVGSYGSQQPAEISVTEHEIETEAPKSINTDIANVESIKSPAPEKTSPQEYKSQITLTGIIPPQINKATKPKKQKTPEKELEEMQELKKISENVAKRRHDIESIVINDKDYVLSIMSTFSSIQNQIYGAASPDKSAEELNLANPANPVEKVAPIQTQPPPPPPIERKTTGIKSEDSYDPKPLSALPYEKLSSPILSETLKSKPSVSSKSSLSRNANKVYVNTNASNENLSKANMVKSPIQTEPISENAVETKPTTEQQTSMAKHTSTADSVNSDDQKNPASYKFWSSKKKDEKSHSQPTKPMARVTDPDKDANTFMVNSKFFDPVNSTAGLYDVEKSLDSFTTSEYPIIPKLWLERVQTFHVIMIPLNGMFDMQAIDLKDSHRFGRNNTTNHPAFKGFGTLVVSRNHVDIFEKDGKVYIKDIGSNSGTFRNNARLSQPGQTSPDVELVTGDYIQLGKDYLQDENNVLDSNGRVQSRRRCVRFQLIVVPPGKTAYEVVKDQLIPIERPVNRSDTNEGPSNIEDDVSPKHHHAAEVKSPETPIPVEKIDKSKTVKRAMTERHGGEISAAISSIQNDKAATPTAVYKSTKDVLNKLAEALDVPKAKEIITKREQYVLAYTVSGSKISKLQINNSAGQLLVDVNLKKWEEKSRLTIQDARPNFNCSYDLFLETKPGAKSPAKLKQFCEGQPWQVVKNNGSPIGHMIFPNEIKLELFPVVKTDNSISLSGDFKEQRFMCIKKAVQSREQKVVGECKGKYMAKKNLRETSWLTNFEIQGEEASQLVLSGVILICLMTH